MGREMSSGRRPKNKVLRCAIIETVYAVWRARNGKIHGEGQVNPKLL